MIPIIKLLNKIKWDKSEKPKEYEIVYFDRIKEQKITMPYKNIKKLEDPFMVVKNKGNKSGEIRIPLHRIQEVKRNNKTIWKR